MIPRDFVTEWRNEAPWPSDDQVEQDLVICRAVVEIFRVEAIARRLAWRGGTALHKLHLGPAARYSEDIDLVQITPEPIGPTLDLLRAVLDPWLGAPKRKLKEGRVVLLYRFDSEGPLVIPLRLKIETNTREHFTEYGHRKIPFRLSSRWFSGEAEVTTFDLDELLGTKLRALYQRKKGRDLFDLWLALKRAEVDPARVIGCFQRYLSEGGHRVSRALFEKNLEAKCRDARFASDILPLLRPGLDWDLLTARDAILREFISRIPGTP